VIVIGIDPHKSSHTATALDAASHQLADKLRIEASLVEYRRLLSWAKRFDERRWAVEDAEGLGRHLTQSRECAQRPGHRDQWRAAEGSSTVLRMFDERRRNLTQQRTRSVTGFTRAGRPAGGWRSD
jgi:transposase